MHLSQTCKAKSPLVDSQCRQVYIGNDKMGQSMQPTYPQLPQFFPESQDIYGYALDVLIKQHVSASSSPDLDTSRVTAFSVHVNPHICRNRAETTMWSN